MNEYRGIKNITEFYEVMLRESLGSYEITKIVLTVLRSNGLDVFEISTWN